MRQMLMVVIIGVLCAGMSIFVTESTVAAANPLDSLSTFAKTTSTKKKCNAKKNEKKKGDKCVKVKCKVKKGFIYKPKNASCKKTSQCDTKNGYKKSGKKCKKPKKSSSSSTNSSSTPAPNPAPKKVEGDGDCTALNYRDDQGFLCNDANNQKICKGIGGHAIKDASGNPKCIKKGDTCPGGYLELHKDPKHERSCIQKDPNGKPGAKVLTPADKEAYPDPKTPPAELQKRRDDCLKAGNTPDFCAMQG